MRLRKSIAFICQPFQVPLVRRNGGSYLGCNRSNTSNGFHYYGIVITDNTGKAHTLRNPILNPVAKALNPTHYCRDTCAISIRGVCRRSANEIQRLHAGLSKINSETTASGICDGKCLSERIEKSR